MPNPFWAGALFPTFVFGVAALYPFVERRLTRDRARHHLLDRPRDRPWRTAFGCALLSWVTLIFFAGSSDRVFLALGFSYEGQVRVYRWLVLMVPLIVFVVVRGVCVELRRSGVRPLRGGPPAVARRRPDGAFEDASR